jgi:RNA polymerase sigma factor (sigma-70 family)
MLGMPSAPPGSASHVDIARADATVEHVDREFGQQLFGLARRSGLSDAEADDAVQDTLIKLWLEIRSGLEILEPRAWTFRVLYRVAMDRHRVRRRALDVLARLSPSGRAGVDPDVIDRISLWTIVDRLPTRQRQVLYLRYKADMAFGQVAAVMGITASAARAHAAFAAVRLRETLGEEWRS